MNKEYYIYTDGSADIDREFVDKHGIRFVPMGYMIDDDEFYCESLQDDESLKEFYDAQRAGKVTKTSQIPPNTYMETFEPVIKEGKGILYLSLSSGLTKTYDSACLAIQNLKEEYEDVQIVAVDTLSATGGMGLLAELAVTNQEKGLSLEENAEKLQGMCDKAVHYFMVDDLMYLKRGGRIPATSAMIGAALNIKPILEITKDGRLVTADKKRGTKMALKAIVSKYKESKDNEFGDRVYIVHGDCPEKADLLEKMILDANPDAKIAKKMLCSVVGAHTGPGMLAAIFFGER